PRYPSKASRIRRTSRAWARGSGARPAEASRASVDGYVVERRFKHRGNPDRTAGRESSRGSDQAFQGTIFEMGSSRMSVAPAAFSWGISVLTVALSTTVSIANPPSESGDTVGDFIEGTTATTSSS